VKPILFQWKPHAFFLGIILLGGFLSAKANNQIIAWGQNAGFGEILVPAGLTNIVTVAAGLRHNMALKSDGTVVTWGACLGGNRIAPVTTPEGLSNVTAIAAGVWHSLALRDDGTVVAWGYNGDGETDVPSNATNVVAIACGAAHSLALKSDGTIICWGAEGANHDKTVTVPSNLSNVVGIAAGGGFNVALKSNGTVVVWGDAPNWLTDVPPSATNIVAITAGGGYCLALTADERVIGWGHDVNFASVTPPSDLSNVVQTAGGEQHCLALKLDGTVVAWGRGWGGTKNFPDGLTNVSAIASRGYHSLAIIGPKESLHLAKKMPILPPPHNHMNLRFWLVVLASLIVLGWIISRLFQRREKTV
jgi:alpha-tubulin suppressor-like RCC1 family protein